MLVLHPWELTSEAVRPRAPVCLEAFGNGLHLLAWQKRGPYSLFGLAVRVFLGMCHPGYAVHSRTSVPSQNLYSYEPLKNSQSKGFSALTWIISFPFKLRVYTVLLVPQDVQLGCWFEIFLTSACTAVISPQYFCAGPCTFYYLCLQGHCSQTRDWT